jgi:hypothetical protein
MEDSRTEGLSVVRNPKTRYFMTMYFVRRAGRAFVGVFCLSLLFPFPANSAAFNYAAQLENVLVKAQGNSVFYRVFDPALGKFVEARETTRSVAGLVSKDGVVVWNDGAVCYARFYDPARGAWMKAQVASASSGNLNVAAGVLTWSSGRLVNQMVYDLSRHAWRINQDAVAGTVYRLQTAAGVVTWSSGRIVYCRAYDPVLGQWAEQDVANPTTATNLTTADGIIAWSSGGSVYLRTYEPLSRQWVGTSVESGAALGLKVNQGVAAWNNSQNVFFQAYDPTRDAWRGGRVASGLTTDLAVRNGTVTWTASDLSPFIRGYDTAKGSWITGPTIPYASFGASANTGEPPMTVYFFDRSLGASGWGWDFGDDNVRFERSPFHTFESTGPTTVTLTVHGPVGPPSTASLLLELGSDGMEP